MKPNTPASNVSLRLTLLVSSICLVLFCAGWVWRSSFVNRDNYTKRVWREAQEAIAAENLAPADQLVFLLGSSVVQCGFKTITTCKVDGERWVFANIGKPHLDHRSYLTCGIYDSIREQYPAAQVWQEARTFYHHNYSDWIHDADFGDKIKSTVFNQIQRELSFDATTFRITKNLRNPDTTTSTPPRPVKVIDSTAAPSWGIENRLYANEWRARKDLALLEDGLIDGMFEMPTCPSTREKNLLPDLNELPSEPLRRIRSLPLLFLREGGEGFWFKDYADPGHMNTYGRHKMAETLCRWAHEAKSWEN